MRIETSAPTRIDLAGGTLDIWPLYLFHPGAQTVNAAINLRAHAVLETRDDARVVIRSEDRDTTVDVDGWQALGNSQRLRLLSLLVHFFEGHGLTLTTSCEAPAGAGLGGSSALNVAACAVLAEWQHTHYDPETLLHVAMNVEAHAIGVPTGLQDYRPALYGGVAALELNVEGVRRVELGVDPEEIERRFVLCYTGEPRDSGVNNWDIMKRHLDGDSSVFDRFERIRDTASTMREALGAGDWDQVGRALADEWENRKQLTPGVTTPGIDRLVGLAMRAGATAAKICGAGGGGCLVCYVPPDRHDEVSAALANGGAKVLDYRVERDGLMRR